LDPTFILKELVVALFRHLKHPCALSESVTFRAELSTVTCFAVDFSFTFAQGRRFEPLIAQGTGETGRFVPGTSTAHHLLGHVNSSPASGTRILGTVFSHTRRSIAVDKRGHVSLSQMRNIRSWRSILPSEIKFNLSKMSV